MEDAAVKVVELPEQIDRLPLIPLITGINRTTTAVEPDTVAEQNVVLASLTETNAYVKVLTVPVGADKVAVFPDEVMVGCITLLML